MDRVLIVFRTLVEQLQSTTGRLEKEAFLSQYKDNEDIKFILNFLFNPYIITGISNKKLAKHLKNSAESTQSKNLVVNEMIPETILELLKYFIENNTGRDIDVQTLTSFTRNMDNIVADLVHGIIKKDLKLGIQEKTLNKVFTSDFIPVMNVMLAESYQDNKSYLDKKEFIITQKMDGVRAVLLFVENTPTFFTRGGRIIVDLVELEVAAKSLNTDFVYDGELVLNTNTDTNSADLYRATVKITNADAEKRNLTFHIFDRVLKSDFVNGRSDETALERKKALHSELDLINSNLKSANDVILLKEVPMLYIGTDASKIEPLLTKFTSKGLEGLMINIASAPYECKRTKNILKVKEFHTADVLVLSIEEGTGANRGKLGAVHVRFTGPDNKPYTCKVGSGFSQEQREYFYNNPSEIIDKIIEIGYFELSKNQNDENYSLRFPTFKHLRLDKTQISMH
ncbi:MAG: hypothetical protein FWE01_02150 [Firmicutes bacterium]|nr:hypothetical protein [Bacillota bacterium]